ncbi:MAG: molecular chaperone TorD family protein [Betaproteobacteria bacterium]|nr:molecular chaperone TorD family protein [Betaproteobacteria bacterium]
MNEASLAGLALGRSRMYWLLSGVFLAPPAAVTLERMAAAVRGLLADEVEELAPALEQLGGALEDRDPGRIESLAAEYTRLFGGLREGWGPPPPFESVWRDSPFCGEVTVAVLRAYEEAGFAGIDEAAGPQDHLGVELKFMALLCHEESAAWGAGAAAARRWLEREHTFLRRHLSAWAPRLFDAVRQQAREPYFRATAMLAAAFLEMEPDLIDEILALHAPERALGAPAAHHAGSAETLADTGGGR